MSLIFSHVKIPVFLIFKLDYKSMRKSILYDSHINRQKENRICEASYAYLKSLGTIISTPRRRLNVRFLARRMNSLVFETKKIVAHLREDFDLVFSQS